MATIGTIKSVTVAKNGDGEKNVRLAEVEMTSEQDVQTVQIMSSLDCSPLPGTKILILNASDAWPIGLILEDGQTPIASDGERFLYAQSALGTIASSVKCKKTGEVVINDGEDYAVAFSKMKEAFDQLRSDLNDLVLKFNTHPGHLPGRPVPAVPAIPSLADMTGSKCSTVKVKNP